MKTPSPQGSTSKYGDFQIRTFRWGWSYRNKIMCKGHFQTCKIHYILLHTHINTSIDAGTRMICINFRLVVWQRKMWLERIKGIPVTIIFDDLFFNRKISKANIENSEDWKKLDNENKNKVAENTILQALQSTYTHPIVAWETLNVLSTSAMQFLRVRKSNHWMEKICLHI